MLTYSTGQGHSKSPSKLPHYYNVLDHFHVTDIFPEKYESLIRWMVRLERINLDEKSWWSAKDAPHSPPNFVSPKAPEQRCMVCNKSSKTIYKQGWTCLNADPEKEVNGGHQKSTCPAFFKFADAVNDMTLEFTDEFLQERTQFQLAAGQVLEPLVPEHLTKEREKAVGALAFAEKCRGGIVCPQCKGCIRRINWGFWKCENPGCTFESRLTPRSVPASLAISSNGKVVPSLQKSKNDAIKVVVLDWGYYKVTMYTLPGEEEGSIAGWIFHFQSCAIINQNVAGPDELFLELQSADLGLKRKASKNKGGEFIDLASK